MLASKTVVIQDQTYKLTRLLATDGIDAGARLVNLLGPSVNGLPSDEQLGVMAIVKMLGPVLSNPELGPTLKTLASMFAKSTMLVGDNGKEAPLAPSYDYHFSDKYDAWLFWLGHSIWFSLESFLRGARVLGGLLAELAPSDSSGQP